MKANEGGMKTVLPIATVILELNQPVIRCQTVVILAF